MNDLLKMKVINLKRRPDRYKNFCDVMERHNVIGVERFDAVDGQQLPMTNEISVQFLKNNFGWRRGVMGAALSHIALWRELANSDARYYLIFEDDIRLCDDFGEYLEHLKNKIDKKTYPFIFLGYHTHAEKLKRPMMFERVADEVVSIYPQIFKDHIWGGLFGYIISRDFAKKLVDDLDKNGIVDPIDVYILKYKELFTTDPILVHSQFMTFTNKVDSDIQYDMLGMFDDYVFFSEKDSPNYDLEHVNIRVFDELKKKASEKKDCIAFNTYGFLKYHLHQPKDFINLVGSNSKAQGLYVKKKYIKFMEELDNDYVYFPGKDSPGNDLCIVKAGTLYKTKEYADYDDECIAFNTLGYLKNKIVHIDKLVDAPRKIEGLYVKKSYLNR